MNTRNYPTQKRAYNISNNNIALNNNNIALNNNSIALNNNSIALNNNSSNLQMMNNNPQMLLVAQMMKITNIITQSFDINIQFTQEENERLKNAQKITEIDRRNVIDNMVVPIGLPNVGLTCYMNATLQCFFHIKELSESILNIKVDKRKQLLTYAFKKIVMALSGRSSYVKQAALEFKAAINDIPIFNGFSAGDAKDLMIYFLQTMHEETNENLDQSFSRATPVEQTNEADVIKDTIMRFCIENNSVFSRLFYGFFKDKFLCTQCMTVTYNMQYFSFIEIPVKQLYNFTYNNGLFFNNNNMLNIINYFEMQQMPKMTEFNNKMYCNQKCFVETMTSSLTRYYVFPNIISIFLNYGKNIEFSWPFYLEEYIDLSRYAQSSSSPTTFRMLGVICHRGASGTSGHYVAYCRHFDGNWYCFNDRVVTKCQFKDCMSSEELPYCLFYEKM